MTPASRSAEDAFFAAVSRLAELSPGMYTKTGASGTRLLYAGLPIPNLNAVCPGPEPDWDEAAAFAAELAATGVPWSIQLQESSPPAARELASRYGLASAETVPMLVWEGDAGVLPETLPSGARVREVPGSEHEVFAAALAAGYPMPKEVADAFARPALLDAPDMTAFVLDVDGEAVASGFNVLVGDRVGLFNGSVPPQHRRHGYYRALVSARLNHAIAHGARRAFAQNTPMSRPLYESLGFRLAENWTYLTA